MNLFHAIRQAEADIVTLIASLGLGAIALFIAPIAGSILGSCFRRSTFQDPGGEGDATPPNTFLGECPPENEVTGSPCGVTLESRREPASGNRAERN
jgi:hypothetical protein